MHDSNRCEQWINNCANDELKTIWKEAPKRVLTLRICQKHFLKEFLGSTSRLVGHAVPAPYGLALEELDAEKFMVECASLKSTSASAAKQSRIRSKYAKLADEADKNQVPLVKSSCPLIPEQVDQIDDIYHEPLIPRDHSSVVVEHEDSFTLVTSISNTSYDTLNASNSIQDSEKSLPSSQRTATQAHSHNLRILPSRQNGSDIREELEEDRGEQSEFNSFNFRANLTKLDRNANPKISYDREGRVVSIQYPNETLSMIKTNDNEQHEAHIVALKHKVRHYQRKLAVINHRYQKLRSQLKGRSNKMRLLESLNICKNDFDPCVFEIFKRQIKGPLSKQGNRWSNEVKTFASSIFLRSRSAYKFIRKTIDLPSESIVKRFVGDKKLSKNLISIRHEVNEDETDVENDHKDGSCCDEEESRHDNAIGIRSGNLNDVGQ